MSDTTAPEPTPESTPAPAPEPAPEPATPTPAVPASAAKPDDPAAASARRSRRGAITAGAISLPLITLGAILLAVPLAVWYLSTVIRTLVVVVANILSGGKAADDANTTLGQIDPAALGGVTLGFAIVGAVFVVAGWLVSYFVLRAHGVARSGHVTGFGVAVGLVIASVLTASVGALTGLIFGTARTVAQVLGNAALSIALTTIGAAVVTVATGILVWVWMERLFRVEGVGADTPPRASSAD